MDNNIVAEDQLREQFTAFIRYKLNKHVLRHGYPLKECLQVITDEVIYYNMDKDLALLYYKYALDNCYE